MQSHNSRRPMYSLRHTCHLEGHSPVLCLPPASQRGPSYQQTGPSQEATSALSLEKGGLWGQVCLEGAVRLTPSRSKSSSDAAHTPRQCTVLTHADSCSSFALVFNFLFIKDWVESSWCHQGLLRNYGLTSGAGLSQLVTMEFLFLVCKQPSYRQLLPHPGWKAAC